MGNRQGQGPRARGTTAPFGSRRTQAPSLVRGRAHPPAAGRASCEAGGPRGRHKPVTKIKIERALSSSPQPPPFRAKETLGVRSHGRVAGPGGASHQGPGLHSRPSHICAAGAPKARGGTTVAAGRTFWTESASGGGGGRAPGGRGCGGGGGWGGPPLGSGRRALRPLRPLRGAKSPGPPPPRPPPGRERLRRRWRRLGPWASRPSPRPRSGRPVLRDGPQPLGPPPPRPAPQGPQGGVERRSGAGAVLRPRRVLKAHLFAGPFNVPLLRLRPSRRALRAWAPAYSSAAPADSCASGDWAPAPPPLAPA